jgi:hypothetical protein
MTTPDDLSTSIHESAATYRGGPHYDLREFTNEDLVTRLTWLQCRAQQLVINVIDSPRRALADVQQHAEVLTRRITPDTVAWLHANGADASELWVLSWLSSHIGDVHCEMRRRFGRVGAALEDLQAENDARARKMLLKALGAKTLLRDGDWSKEEDLRALAVAKTYERAVAAGSEAIRDLVLPTRIPQREPPPHALALRRASSEDGRGDWPSLRATRLADNLRRYLPALRGDTERVVLWAGRQALRDHHKANQKKRNVWIQDDGAPGLAADDFRLRQSAADRAQAAMSFARQRWGAPGEAFLQALLEGKTVAQAARAAGVSRRTGQTWRRELKRADAKNR